MQGSPFSSDPLHYFNASQHTGLPLPHVAVALEVLPGGKEVELDHTEHPIAVLDKNTKPEEEKETNNKDKIKLIFFITIRQTSSSEKCTC